MGTLPRTVSYALALLFIAPGAFAESVEALPTDRGSSQLGFLFSNYYETDLAALENRASWISDNDVAVALHIVRHSDVELDQVVALRREGRSWDTITRRCGLSCEVYFVELEAGVPRPEPYARPYVTWNTDPGSDLRLSDVEIRELVLLRAMSDYCQAAAEDVVRLRVAGHTPQAIAAQHPPQQHDE